jgi:hypothetical protein
LRIAMPTMLSMSPRRYFCSRAGVVERLATMSFIRSGDSRLVRAAISLGAAASCSQMMRSISSRLAPTS